MLVTVAGITILEKLFPAKARSPILVILSGIFIDVSPSIQFFASLQPKAAEGTSVIFLDKLILSSLGFVANAPAPRVVTVSGRITLLSSFTWKAAIPISTRDDGNVTSFNPLFANALFPIFSTSLGSSTLSKPSPSAPKSPYVSVDDASSVMYWPDAFLSGITRFLLIFLFAIPLSVSPVITVPSTVKSEMFQLLVSGFFVSVVPSLTISFWCHDLMFSVCFAIV